ncbi:MAG: alpha/beta fold hydrolase [Rhodothermales bacterium]
MSRCAVFSLLCLAALTSASYAQPSHVNAALSHELTFSSASVELAATLHIPAGKSPFPGVVLIHGSGSSDRSNPWTSAYASALVERGVAVVHPDKRGSGESGGDWREAGFDELAQDAVAALDILYTNELIDSTRVGFVGFSQGGHIAPVATIRSSAAFVINVSGSVVPILEQIGDELRLMGEREGLSKEALNTVHSLHEHAASYALTGQHWRAYSDLLAGAKRGALREADIVKGFPTEPDSDAWEFLRTVGDFDPMPYSLLLFRNNGHALFREDAMDFIARWISNGGTD